MRVIVALIVFVLVVVGAAVAYVYSGLYNIAATDPHNPVVRWALDAAMVRSVKTHAQGIPVPDLADPSRIEAGATHFRETCVMCHGAPGVERAEIGKGLKPVPPDVSGAAQTWSPAEIFWIIKHGIKMTGMPAWGPTHGDDELWAITAFVEALPGTSPEEYQRLAGSPPEGGHGHATGH